MSFSIIVPSFNQAKYLPEALDSILSQPELLECLVYDADSTDGSKEILKKYAKKYPKLWYQSKKDGGQASAINLGLKKATGDYVAYLNSDDYYLPGSFSKVKKYFDSHPGCLWLVGDCEVSQKNLRWTFFIKNFLPLPIFNSINQPSVFLRQDFVKKVGYFNTKYRYAFDYDYWLRSSMVYAPAHLHQKLAVFRIHNFSKSNTNYLNQFDEDLQICRQYTNNQLILFLHFIISRITILAYKFLKK